MRPTAAMIIEPTSVRAGGTLLSSFLPFRVTFHDDGVAATAAAVAYDVERTAGAWEPTDSIHSTRGGGKRNK